jgi:hypothetical protein
VGGSVGQSPSAPSKKLYEYDAATDSWTAKTDFPGDARSSGTAFTLGAKGYYGLGASTASGTSFNLYTNFYAYDPASNKWGPEITGFPASGRLDMASGVVNNKAYVGLGWKYVSGNTTHYADWHELAVAGVGIGAEQMSHLALSCYPNPASRQIHIALQGVDGRNKAYAISNLTGATVRSGNLPENGIIDLGQLQDGVYILTVCSGNLHGQSLLEVRN